MYAFHIRILVSLNKCRDWDSQLHNHTIYSLLQTWEKYTHNIHTEIAGMESRKAVK